MFQTHFFWDFEFRICFEFRDSNFGFSFAELHNRCILGMNMTTNDKGLRIAISGKGGVGKTTLTVLLAKLFADEASNVIVIDAGTATTIDVARRDGNYLGGIICPGMQLLADMMHQKTAQLPRISVRKPRSLIGRSTEECLRSGLFNGTIAMVRGLIKDIRKSKKGNFLCVATGGSGKLLSSYVEGIQKYDADLCLYGILSVYYENV